MIDEEGELANQIKEVESGCMAGLLLCLEIEERLLFIIKVNYSYVSDLFKLSKVRIRTFVRQPADMSSIEVILFEAE